LPHAAASPRMTLLHLLGCALLLTGPGLLLVRRAEWRSVQALALVPLGSLGLLAILIWFVPPGWFRMASVLVAAFGWIAAARSWRHRGPPSAIPAAALVALALGVGLRVATFLANPGPSTGDLTLHASMVELIEMSDGMPRTHEPLLPIPAFGAYAPGLHASAALIGGFTQVPSWSAALLIGLVGLSFVPVGLASLVLALRPQARPGPVLIGCCAAVLVSRNPQLFVGWGGVPTILALGLLLLAAADIVRLHAAFDAGLAVRAGTLMAAALICHPLPVVCGTWVIGLCASWSVAKDIAQGNTRWRRRATGLSLAAAVAAILAFPYLRLAAIEPSPELLSWARGWFLSELRWPLLFENRLRDGLGFAATTPSVTTFPFYVVAQMGLLSAAVTASWLAWPGRTRLEARPIALAIVAVVLFLFVGSVGEFLPGWSTYYPTRVALLLLVPCGLAFTAAAEAVFRWSVRSRLALVGAVAVAASAEGLVIANGDRTRDFAGAFSGAAWRSLLDHTNARLTGDDRAAFDWIRRNTPPGAVFAANIDDGGQLLPAGAHRKIIDPHYPFMWYRPVMEEWAATHTFDHVFVGARPSGRFPDDWARSCLDGRSDRYRLVAESGQARVYRVVGPPLPAAGGTTCPAPDASGTGSVRSKDSRPHPPRSAAAS
jgi:hypothetical protein